MKDHRIIIENYIYFVLYKILHGTTIPNQYQSYAEHYEDDSRCFSPSRTYANNIPDTSGYKTPSLWASFPQLRYR